MAMYKIYLICITLVVILSGCQASPEEKIYQILEVTVSKEKNFDKQQKPLMELESQEKKLFDKIINHGMKDKDLVISLSNEALENLEQRRERMKIEEAAIQSSKKEFKKIKVPIENIKHEKVKEKADNLFLLMEKRYEYHEKLFEAYNSGIDINIKLYQMFKQKDLSIETLQKQIELSNEAYSEVLKMNKKFNESTKKFNESKLNFYKEANIKITS